MDYKEMESHTDITVGDRVWICDYRFNNILDKPIRHVEPKEVVVVSNCELPENKRVYYATVHFRPIGKKGQILKQIIAPFDNTGYRGYTGVSLQIFPTKEECIDYYLEQCREIKLQIAGERYSIEQQFNRMENEINEKMKKFK